MLKYSFQSYTGGFLIPNIEINLGNKKGRLQGTFEKIPESTVINTEYFHIFTSSK
jgi:hypothetical protein